MTILAFAIYVGVSTVVLVASMFVAAKFFGMSFGPVDQAALKGAGIILISSLGSMFLPYVGLVVWLIGLKALFDLEWGEVIILTLVNWGLTFLLIMALRSMLTA